jgi:hypothetical protein
MTGPEVSAFCSPGGSRLETVDARIARSGHQGSHEFARHAAVLPFVGHEDRDLSVVGSVSSRA